MPDTDAHITTLEKYRQELLKEGEKLHQETPLLATPQELLSFEEGYRSFMSKISIMDPTFWTTKQVTLWATYVTI